LKPNQLNGFKAFLAQQVVNEFAGKYGLTETVVREHAKLVVDKLAELTDSGWDLWTSPERLALDISMAIMETEKALKGDELL
jgi:hypothetical protein